MVRRNALSGSGVGDTLAKLLSNTGLMENPPEYPGERHAKNYHFLGPQTALEQRARDANLPSKPNTPINALDAAAKRHDYAYKATGDKLKSAAISQPEALREIHNADDAFIEELKQIPGISLTKALASKAILLKKYGEKLGVLNPEEFSLSGTGLLPPDNTLRKQKRLKQTGGFLPALVPFLAPILSSLAVAGVEKLISHFAEKNKKQAQEGSGISLSRSSTLDDKKRYTAHALDNMLPNQQIEYMFNNLIKKT